MSEWKEKRRVMRHYDQSAKVYDVQYKEEQGAKIETALEKVKLDQNTALLDLGCGTGLLFDYVAGETRFLVGVDLSRQMLKEARRKTKQCKRALLIRADADRLPFRKLTFDMVFALTLMQNIPNPVATLEEIKRISKLDAAVVVTGLKKSFTEQRFLSLLKRANLEVVTSKLDKQMKEYVCICTKVRR